MQFKNYRDLIDKALFIGSTQSFFVAVLNIFIHSIPYLWFNVSVLADTLRWHPKERQLV